VLATMRENEAKSYGLLDDERKQHASLVIVKNNYGPSGDVFWFKRTSFDGVGLLEHVNLNVHEPAVKSSATLEAKIVEFVGINAGQYSKTRLRDTQSGKKGPLKASKGEVERAIEALIKDGRLANRAPTNEERKKYDHGPRVKNVLDLR